MRLGFTWAPLGCTDFGFVVRRGQLFTPFVKILSLCLVTGLVGSASAQQAESFELSKSLQKKITEKVAPLLENDDYTAFQMELGKIITKAKIAQFDDIDALGRTLSVNSLKAIYFDQRKDELLSGRAVDGLKLKRSVAFYLAAGLVDAVERLANEVDGHELVSTDEPPEDWRESRNFFLGAESLVRRIEDLEHIARRLDQTLKPFRKSRKPKQDIATALDDFQNAADKVLALRQQVSEKEAVLRLQRLNNAAQTLMQHHGDFEKSLIAALFLDEDIAELTIFFNKYFDFVSPELSPAIAASLPQTIQNVKAANNPAVDKALLLTKGLYQWRRGRYGIGRLAGGLLKQKPFLSRRLRQLTSFAGSLMMPENPTVISQALGSESGIGYDRRHYYTWDLEYRPLRTTRSQDGKRESDIVGRRVTSPWRSQVLQCGGSTYVQHSRDVELDKVVSTESTTITRRSFAPQDNSIPPRIVGTVEYAAAIDYFERLVAQSTPEQIEIYDKVIGEMPEFAFYSGMTAGIEQPKPAAGNGQQNNAAAQLPNGLNSQFKKQSLAWLLALARVELASTKSMYVAGDESFMPTGPMFGMTEYYHVLLDDVAAHLMAIQTDHQFERALKKGVNDASSETIAYLRRLKLISSMLGALQTSPDLVIAQKAKEFGKKVERFNRVLETMVAVSSLDSIQFNSSRSERTIQTREVVNRPHQ